MERETAMSELILVRHGETVGESAVRLYGSTDIEMSDWGRRQMAASHEALAGLNFAYAASSPLSRSMEAAQIVIGKRKTVKNIIEGFREIDFGRWEGWSLAEAAEKDPENYRKWQSSGVEFRFPGGDMKKEFFQRTAEAAKEILGKAPRPALAVLHKGVIKGILAGLLERPVADFVEHKIELGSIHRLSRSKAGWEIISSNETGHLGEFRIPSSA